MTEATQQALLPPEPTRAIRAPANAIHLGVDPSTKRVAVGWQGGAATRSFPTHVRGGARLSGIYRETRYFAADLCELLPGPPAFILVEQPSGKTPNPQLVYAVGVIQAAMFDGIWSKLGRQPWVETISSSEWRKLATGRGDAGYSNRGGKPELVRLARENGYQGSSEDEAEAFLIALAARRLVRFAE